MESIRYFLLQNDYTVDTVSWQLPADARAVAQMAYKQRFHEGPLRFQKHPANPGKSGQVDGPSRVIRFYLRREQEYVVFYQHGGFSTHNHLLLINSAKKTVEFFHYHGSIEHWGDAVNKLRKSAAAGQELLAVSDLEA